jgi:hypothetical protein
MSYDVTIKRGDTRNCIKAVLKDYSGAPVDLTGCSVDFHMAPLNRPAVISRAVHIEDAGNGEVWMVWAPGETDIAGIFRAEFGVVYQDGRRETFPNNGYISLLIQNDLGG